MSFVPILIVVLVEETFPDTDFPPLASSKLGFLTDLVVVVGDFNDSLVLGCFCSLAAETEVLSGVTGVFGCPSESDVDLLGIFDFEPVALVGLLALWSFNAGNTDNVCGGLSLEASTFMACVELFAFVVTFLVLLPAAEVGVFVPLVVVCRLSAAPLTPWLEGAARLVPWPLTPDSAGCDFVLYMSEDAEVSSESVGESVFSLTKGSGVFGMVCVVSSVLVDSSSFASLDSALLLFWRLGRLSEERETTIMFLHKG